MVSVTISRVVSLGVVFVAFMVCASCVTKVKQRVTFHVSQEMMDEIGNDNDFEADIRKQVLERLQQECSQNVEFTITGDDDDETAANTQGKTTSETSLQNCNFETKWTIQSKLINNKETTVTPTAEPSTTQDGEPSSMPISTKGTTPELSSTTPITTKEATPEPSSTMPITTKGTTPELSSTTPITTKGTTPELSSTMSITTQEMTTNVDSSCGQLSVNASTGVVCNNSPEAGVTSSYRCEWTDWYDRDDPSGTRDGEILSFLRDEYPDEICAVPTCIQARVKSSKLSYTTTGHVVRISPCTGFQCRNREQPECQTGVCCADYEVRFCCSTGIEWNGKYFWARIPADEINYSQAVDECRNSKGSGFAHPANIYDAMHYNNITEYLGAQSTENKAKFWLGMTYSNTDNILRLSNEEVASYKNWKDGHPKSGKGQHIALEVAENGDDGMIFSEDEDTDRHGVLCEEILNL